MVQKKTHSVPVASGEDVKDVKHVNGGVPLKASPFGKGVVKSNHHRAATIDNAFLMEERRSLEHSDVDDRHSLRSLGDLDDGTAGLSDSPDLGLPPELLEILANPSIEDNTPAAEALRANAEIHVRKLGKLARRIHGQTVRRVVKRATLRSKSGRVRGKPPRIPPTRVPSGSVPAGRDNQIYVVHEEDEVEDILEDEMDSSLESSESSEEYEHDHDEEAMFAAASGEAHQKSQQEDVIVEEDKAVVDKVPGWQTHLTEGPEMVPAEVLTATMETGKKGKIMFCALWFDSQHAITLISSLILHGS